MQMKLTDDNCLFGGCFPAGDFWKQIFILVQKRNATHALNDSPCESGHGGSGAGQSPQGGEERCQPLPWKDELDQAEQPGHRAPQMLSALSG